jgi:ribosome-associated protein
MSNNDFNPEHEPDEDWVSKSQKKREMDERQALGAKLPALNPEQLAKVPMSPTLMSAVKEA